MVTVIGRKKKKRKERKGGEGRREEGRMEGKKEWRKKGRSKENSPEFKKLLLSMTWTPNFWEWRDTEIKSAHSCHSPGH